MLTFPNAESLSKLQLDIVGIVAVLGEGCTSRTLQASALSWPHILPRLLPAPQALLKHEQAARLPTHPGAVIGVYSGNFKEDLNFFIYLLHDKSLEPNVVELLRVEKEAETLPNRQAFDVGSFGWIPILSWLGCIMAFALIGTAIALKDGFALVATVLLAATSSIVGIASWWDLKFKEVEPKNDRKDKIPDADLVIYYPNGAFRVVQCSEDVSRLYFQTEVCKPKFNDNIYRISALSASIFLMIGLLCMGNAQSIMQILFAAFYITLNVLHWAVSAVNPKYHWRHKYKVIPMKFQAPRLNELQLAVDTDANGKPTAAPSAAPAMSDGARTNSPIPVSPGVRSPTNSGPNGLKHSQVTFNTSEHKPESGQEPQLVTSKKRSLTSDLEAGLGRLMSPLRSMTDPKKLFRRQSSHQSVASDGIHREVPKEDRRFTAALWQVIALTGSSRWLENTHIAPDNDVWKRWIHQAGLRAKSKISMKDQDKIVAAYVRGDKDADVIKLPVWDYQGALNKLFDEEKEENKRRPKNAVRLAKVTIPITVCVRLKRLLREARTRVKEKKERQIQAARAMSPTRAGRPLSPRKTGMIPALKKRLTGSPPNGRVRPAVVTPS